MTREFRVTSLKEKLGTILSICCVSNCCLSLLNVIWLRFLMVKTPPLPPPPKKKEKIGIS